MPKSFTPENTKDMLYIRANYSSVNLSDLLSQIRSHFGIKDDDEFYYPVYEDFEITAEHIHTDCIGYDLYDASDYTNYIVIERKPR
jgi:hypothetical protein